MMKILYNATKWLQVHEMSFLKYVASYICIACFYFFTDQPTQLKKAKQQVFVYRAVGSNLKVGRPSTVS